MHAHTQCAIDSRRETSVSVCTLQFFLGAVCTYSITTHVLVGVPMACVAVIYPLRKRVRRILLLLLPLMV